MGVATLAQGSPEQAPSPGGWEMTASDPRMVWKVKGTSEHRDGPPKRTQMSERTKTKEQEEERCTKKPMPKRMGKELHSV